MKRYITTPIYYVNGEPHIGHAYTTFIADALSRYFRLTSYDTFFLTGTDEHGQKIEESAKKFNKPTQAFADEISAKFKDLWDEFGISYDKFIRTTDEEHKKGVQAAFLKMYQKGDIYKGEYEGHYCVSCEAFFPETQLIDGEFCPDCGRSTQIVKEESYFFRLSNYEQKLLEFYEQNPDFILPKSRFNEVINFVKSGLKDLSVTRTSFSWGVKLPNKLNEPKHVMYVWLDALLNYVTALGYGSENDTLMQKFWPADIHLVGKDILRFHAIYWPAFLMSLELPLPKHVAAHGWWTRDGEKMSKSKGNVIHPKEVADAYGVENLRYFMLREVPFGQDGDFSQRAFIDRINSDLGNDLGNLLNRIIGMSGKYSDFVIDSKDVATFHQKELDTMHKTLSKLDSYMQNVQPHKYLEELWQLFVLGNQTIQESEPWAKMKQGRSDEALATVALVANILAKASLMLYPIMPQTATKIASALKIEISQESFQKYIQNKELLETFTIEKIPPLFPRIEEPRLPEAPAAKPNETKKQEDEKKEQDNLIEIGDFFKTELKVGTVVEAKEVPKSKKLLLLQVDLGEEKPRQIVAGIKEFYTPDELVNTQVCVVANLKPAKLMGHISQGMLLAAKDEDGLCLIRPQKPKKAGTPIG